MGADLLVRALARIWEVWSIASNTPAWISAIATGTLGIFGAIFTVWQYMGNGFRPHCSAKIDLNRQAILLLIRNRGRAAGVIARIVLVDPAGLAIDAPTPIDGYAEGFEATTLPGGAAMRLILGRPPGSRTLPDGVRVKVDWGTGDTVLKPTPVDVGYVGLPSVLPPART